MVAAGVAIGFIRSERRQNESIARAMTGGDPARAPALIRRYGCAGCHTIPGIPGGDGKVGASLADLRSRVYIAGVAANAPDNLIRWIVSPQALSPRTAMPATGITEAEARDVAAYLYAQ
ncbi:c-type cytochrome [Bradyrhizobium sp. C-145]|uniref:c-type cytochrome n=1 Tax=Bradyrhizobium sp. C-145 TaxID=574727 RepID=UPI00201B765B|nr:c-type cytochrome [Bradyrhizobium sp. C-145]UQR60257.1 c-type cytochrome [Bradyrhizobium sp. C-145]